jgi:hypothetical protein
MLQQTKTHSVDTTVDSNAADTTYTLLKTTQRKMGVGRVKMGALLCVVQDNEVWKGRSGGNTFRQFLVEEGIEPKAAMQYMLVARVFILELGITAADLDAICTASMRNLCAAAAIARPENVQDIIDILRSLSRAEAKEALRLLTPDSRPLGDKVSDRTPVSKILNQMDDLSFDQKTDLFIKMGINKKPQLPYHSFASDK